jgi:hypothetical protein
MQTSAFLCKDAIYETINLYLATKIHAPKNCHIKFAKHTTTSAFTSRTSTPPLQFVWAWNLFTLPSNSVDNHQHLDPMFNDLRNKIYNIQGNVTSPESFKTMPTSSTFFPQQNCNHHLAYIGNDFYTLLSLIFNSTC